MLKSIGKYAAAALALCVVPAVAHAGTATGTGSAALSVDNQCSISGATVDLGTFRTNQTWGDVTSALGQLEGSVFYPGSRGLQYLDYGSITCAAGLPYTATITGSDSLNQFITLTVNGQSLYIFHFVKKLGGTTLADNSPVFVTAGTLGPSGFSGVGTGAAQKMLGNVVIYGLASTPVLDPTRQLGAAGAFSDTLSHTLNF
jgi:hypothetical protein